MAKRKVRKCMMCGEQGNIEDMEEINGKCYHKGACLDKYNAELELKKAKKSDWDNLFEYICDLFNIDRPTGFMFKQLETFRKEYGYTDIGMLLTLKYCFETLNMNILDEAGLGIIPYYYDQAKKHNNCIWDLEDYLQDFEYTEKEKTVKIKRHISKDNKIKNKILEFNKINWEDEDE